MRKWSLALGVALVVWPRLTSAQIVTLPVQVLADRVTIGSQFVPRCANVIGNLIISTGQTVTLADGAVWSCVEIAGTLKINRVSDTTARITTLLNLPGGTLDAGTAADRVTGKVDIKIRDVPIDTTKDPFQWGNGLVNFGTRLEAGIYKTPFVNLVVDPVQGASTLLLATAVTGWQVGDELLVPDTAQSDYPAKPRREATVMIASISMGTAITLSKPLDFSHPSVFPPVGAPAGVSPLRPIVANVTRNIVIESENPFGTRGHVANIGDSACWDIEGTASIGLGRTTAAPLDNTSADGVTHIGTNQIAKYTEHDHFVHMGMACGTPRTRNDNVYRGVGNGKWGLVIHQTHDTINDQNIGFDFPGAPVVTEDGNEVRNTFTNSLWLYNLNPATDGSHTDPVADLAQGMPGTEGGPWHHGVMNIFRGNQSWNNNIGANLFDQAVVQSYYPSVPGGLPDTLLSSTLTYLPSNGPFITLSDFTAVGNTTIGLDFWGIKRAPVDSYRSVNNHRGVQLSASDQQNGWFRQPTLIGSYPLGDGSAVSLDDLYYAGQCMKSTPAYVATLEIDGGYFGGCPTGLFGGAGLATVTGTTFQNVVDIDLRDGGIRDTASSFANLTFLPYGQHPHRFVVMFDGTVWDGTGPYPLPGGGAPPPPPPPPPPIWNTLAMLDDGRLFQQLSGSTTQFRLCTDASLTSCQLLTGQ